MTLHEALGSIALIVAAMALAALIETAAPLFAREGPSRGRLRANLGLSALTLATNWALGALAASAALLPGAGRDGGLVALGWGAPATLAATLAMLDLATYLAHRSMHLLPALWRVHRVHHADPFLDVTTTLRQHPLETLWRFLWIAVPTWALGLPLAGVLVYRVVSALQGVAEHANVRVWAPLDRLVSLVWCTPNMHKIHHSRRAAEADTNYGNLLALYDRALGTFTRTDRAFGVSYGLDDVGPSEAKSFTRLLACPFRRRAGRRDPGVGEADILQEG